jgi:protoheme IX farnesyltransferase
MAELIGVEAECKSTWRDYLELCKPKVVALLLVTAVVGMHLASPGFVPFDVLVFGTIGIGFAAASAAVINHVVDEHIDARMNRTLRRPIPQGNMNPRRAIAFSAMLGVLSMLILTVFINPLTAILSLAGLVGYAFVYTMFLKHATPQNIVIGGLSGALPPLLGWTAVTNAVEAPAIILVLIIFAWTPPHFWALAIDRVEDYKKAGVPMLPVTHGIEFTKSYIIFYTLMLVLITILPYVIGMSGLLYLLGALSLGAWFSFYAFKLKFNPDDKTAIKTFFISIKYLFALFILLLLDRYLSPLLGV